MRYRWFLIACMLASSIAHPAFSAMPNKAPRISGFVAGPVQTIQHEPIMLSFALTNNGEKPIYSGEPYSRTTYSANESIWSKGYQTDSGRYMVGISTNAGDDNYPYRWGFAGYLNRGVTTTILGYLSFPDTGKYILTAVLMRGENVVDPDTVKTVVVTVQQPVESAPSLPNGWSPYEEEPAPADAGCNGEGSYGPDFACMGNPYPQFQVMPWVYQVNPYLQIVGSMIAIPSNGNGVVIYAESPLVITNGYPLVVPPNMFNKWGYIPYLPGF